MSGASTDITDDPRIIAPRRPELANCTNPETRFCRNQTDGRLRPASQQERDQLLQGLPRQILRAQDKLPLVQNAINMLAPELNQTDLQDSYRQEFAELIKYIR